MAVVQTGSVLEFATVSTANTGTVSTTITVPADAEFIVVGISGYGGTASFYSGGGMTFTKGGVDTAMTAVTGGDSSSSFWQAAIFYLVAPDTGSNKTLKWDWSGTGTATDAFSCSITFWKGLDTASPVRSSGGAQAGGVPFTTPTLTAASGDLILAWVGANATGSEGSIDSWSNLTLLDQFTIGAQLADGAWATGSPSGNTTVAASTSTNLNDGGIVAIVIRPSGAATPKFSSKGTIGATGNTTANQTSIVLTTATTNVAIGDLVVIAVAVDNTSTTDQDASEISGVTSSPANTWTKAREWTNGQGTAQTGATVSMWYTVATAAMNTGSTITATFTTSASADAQGIIGWCFTKPPGNVRIEATNVAATDGADPAALDATTRNVECLRIRAIGSEGAGSGNAPSLIPTSGWTAWGDGNSVLAMTAAEMYVRAEHLISTATGASSDPTTWAADNASVYVAFTPPAYMFFERKISPRKNTLLRM